MVTWTALLWREFSQQYGGVIYVRRKTQSKTNSLKMEDWDIPSEDVDDFESRYADELEMLDDFDGKCKRRC